MDLQSRLLIMLLILLKKIVLESLILLLCNINRGQNCTRVNIVWNLLDLWFGGLAFCKSIKSVFGPEGLQKNLSQLQKARIAGFTL